MYVTVSLLDLKSVPHDWSPNRGGALAHDAVSLFVLHYTAGLSFSSSVNWLKKPEAKASAHFVIGRQGELIQLVPLDRVAWHAGVSTWRGRPNCNFYSIGVELDNPGPLAKRADGSYVSVVGSKAVAPEDVLVADHKIGHVCPYHAWHKYSEPQLAKLSELLTELRLAFPAVKEIVGHDDIAPGRKFDVGPAFPKSHLTSA
jgi:N-acetylmuramoyl-L-alanine amidase